MVALYPQHVPILEQSQYTLVGYTFGQFLLSCKYVHMVDIGTGPYFEQCCFYRYAQMYIPKYRALSKEAWEPIHGNRVSDSSEGLSL